MGIVYMPVAVITLLWAAAARLLMLPIDLSFLRVLRAKYSCRHTIPPIAWQDLLWYRLFRQDHNGIGYHRGYGETPGSCSAPSERPRILSSAGRQGRNYRRQAPLRCYVGRGSA